MFNETEKNVIFPMVKTLLRQKPKNLLGYQPNFYKKKFYCPQLDF